MESNEFATEREGAYFVIMIGIACRGWLDRSEKDREIDLFDFQRRAIEGALLDGISAGSLDDAGVSDETIAAICTEWNIPNVIDTWGADLALACAQNRAVLGIDGDAICSIPHARGG